MRREASIDCRTGRRSDSRLLPSLSRVTPSAVSEHFSELLGCPISRSLTACCVCLELRPLPSPGITRLLRYCGPLRHPSAPGLSLTGVRLTIPGHASGFPVLRALPLCTCCRHYPGAADGRTRRSNLSHPYQPSPIPLSGRPAHRPFRGLLSVHSRCGLHTRAVTKFVTAIRRLQTFRLLHACSGCFRLERIAGWALHPLEKRRLVTAHVDCRPSPIPWRRNPRGSAQCATSVVLQRRVAKLMGRGKAVVVDGVRSPVEAATICARSARGSVPPRDTPSRGQGDNRPALITEAIGTPGDPLMFG